jgi:predicted acylesterase/phospholipase RssA
LSTAPHETKRAHLVLSSGGVRCIAYIGALEQLEGEGYEFASVSTCSAGTFVGALYCCGLSPAAMREATVRLDLRELAGDVKLKWLRRLWTLRSWPYALYREPGIPRVFRRVLAEQGLESEPTLRDVRIPMATAAVDVAADRLLVYTTETNPAMRVSELLRIATAIPLMYAPHTSSNREVLDAAVASATPFWLAAGQGEDLPIIALRVPSPAAPDRRLEVVGWVNDVLSCGIASRDTFELERLPGVTVIDIHTGVSTFDFGLSPAAREELIERGRAAVAERLERDAERAFPPPPPADDDDRAERQATKLFQIHQDKVARTRTPTVFLSYAREDREWVDRLRSKLGPLLINRDVSVWDDSYIAAGASWDAAIHDAILRARVAVLFVSEHFRKSEYAYGTELTLLREQLAKARVRILWLSVDGSLPDDPEQDLQAGHDPANPLERLNDAAADEALREVAGLVEQDFERSSARGTERHGH